MYSVYLFYADCNVQVLNTGERCTELMKELEGSRNKMRLLISCYPTMPIGSAGYIRHCLYVYMCVHKIFCKRYLWHGLTEGDEIW